MGRGTSGRPPLPNENYQARRSDGRGFRLRNRRAVHSGGPGSPLSQQPRAGKTGRRAANAAGSDASSTELCQGPVTCTKWAHCGKCCPLTGRQPGRVRKLPAVRDRPHYGAIAVSPRKSGRPVSTSCQPQAGLKMKGWLSSMSPKGRLWPKKAVPNHARPGPGYRKTPCRPPAALLHGPGRLLLQSLDWFGGKTPGEGTPQNNGAQRPLRRQSRRSLPARRGAFACFRKPLYQ